SETNSKIQQGVTKSRPCSLVFLLAGQLDRVTLGRRRVGQLDCQRGRIFLVILGGDLGGRRRTWRLAPFVWVRVDHFEPPNRSPSPRVGPLHPRGHQIPLAIRDRSGTAHPNVVPLGRVGNEFENSVRHRLAVQVDLPTSRNPLDATPSHGDKGGQQGGADPHPGGRTTSIHVCHLKFRKETMCPARPLTRLPVAAKSV